jgi:hypothetical protein
MPNIIKENSFLINEIQIQFGIPEDKNSLIYEISKNQWIFGPGRDPVGPSGKQDLVLQVQQVQ